MGKQPSETEKKELLKKLWEPIAGCIGAILLVYNFIKLWQGDQGTITWITASFALIILVLTLIRLGFTKEEIHNKLITPTVYHSRQPHYPKYYKLARFGLLVIGLLVAVLGYSLILRLRELERKTVVLIANFDGPDPQKYGFTEDLIAKLQYSFQDYDEILIIPLDRIIREQQGSNLARTEGIRRRADLVIWGGYSIPDGNTKLTVHIEIMSQSKLITLQSSELSQMQTQNGESQNSILQQQFVGEMKDLVNFVTGSIYLEAGDSEAALKWYANVSLQNGSLINLADTLFYKGIAYANLEQYENAIKDFNEAIKLDPNNSAIYYNLGVSYIALSHYDDAFINFDRAINLKSDYALAYIGRGTCYTYSNEYINAVLDFDKAIKLDPQNTTAYVSRGNAFYLSHQYEQSILDFNYAILLDSQNMGAYSNRANTYMAIGEYEKAIADYNKAIELEPLNAAIYVGRGNIYTLTEKYDLAISDYEKSINLDPSYGLAPYNLGNLYTNLSEYDQAIINFDKAIQLDPQMSEAYFNRGITHIALEQTEQAIVDFYKVLELTNNSNVDIAINNDAKYQLAQIYYNIGYSQNNEGQYEDAIINYDKAIAFNPKLTQAYGNKGHIHILLGQTDDAISSLQKFLELLSYTSQEAHKEAETYVSERYAEIGYSNAINGQYEQGIVFLDKAIALNPKFAVAYSSRGVIYGVLGKFDEAIIDLNKAIELNPQGADAYSSRGVVYSERGKFDEAIIDLNKAIELNSESAIAYFNRGKVYTKLGQSERAINDLSKVLELIGNTNPELREEAENMLKGLNENP